MIRVILALLEDFIPNLIWSVLNISILDDHIAQTEGKYNHKDIPHGVQAEGVEGGTVIYWYRPHLNCNVIL